MRSARRKENGSAKGRLLWVALMMVTWMILIIWRLAWIQVIDHGHYVERAARTQQREIETVPVRGTILDREGRQLAYSLVSDSLYVDLKILKEEKDRDKAAKVLSPMIGMTEEGLRGKLNGDTAFRWLARKLDPDLSRRIRKAIDAGGLEGIGIRKETQRVYPNDSLASHVLGFVGSEDQGLAGLEQVWDDLLRGRPGEVRMAVDARRVAFDRSEIPSLSGATINTTIDMSIQHKVESLIAATLKTYRARGVSAIVMKPDTGEIVALANAPAYDPNRRPGKGEMEIRSNRAIGFPFEPGSVFKVVAYSAAFEEGLVTPDDKVDCGNGEIRFGKRVIHDTHAYGVLSVADAFAKSSNVGAIKLAMKVGREKFYDYITRFGFGSKTGIELPGESRGIVNPLARWAGDSIGSVAMGQEISVTMVQAAVAMAAFANGGHRVKPHIISNIVAQGDRVIYQADLKSERVISPETAEKMSGLLQRVVTAGTGRSAVKLSGYTAAGKTGTPQKVDEKTRAYSKSKYMPTFAGFVPATEPQFVIVVMVDEPVGQYYGGVVAAPVFNMIAQAVLGDYAIPPDDQGFRDALAKLAKKYEGMEGVSAAAGMPEDKPEEKPEAKPAERPRENVAAGSSVSASLSPLGLPKTAKRPGNLSADVAAIMPDFRGRGLRSVAEACAGLRLNPRLLGSGIAYRQSPEPGAPIRPGDECRVEFR